jgi:predicted PurR-regulated permease PerM
MPAASDVDDPPTRPMRELVGGRNVSLTVIALLLVLFALHWASVVFIPLLMGVMFSYALTPAVDALRRWHVPRPIGAALLLVAILSAIGWVGYTLRDDADGLIESLPAAARQLKESVRGPSNQPESNFEKMQKAATQLEQATLDAPLPSSALRGVTRVQIEKPAFSIKDYVVVGGLRLAELTGQLTIVCLITYFLLSSGDAFRRKLVRIAGPTFGRRRITVEAFNEITQQIQRYLLVQLLSSVAVGIATAAAFWAIGMQHAPVWGVVAAVLNLIPYIGSIVLCGVSAVVALTQFGSIDKALLVAGICVVLHIVSGHLVGPWLTGRTSRLSAVVVFVGVLAWGWLWGVPGLLLGAPILMAVKAVCDRIDDWKPIGELLGRDDAERDDAPPVAA